MQESINGIPKFGGNPIGEYNKLLGNSLGSANFEQADKSFSEFQNILSKELTNIQSQDNSGDIFSLGVSMDDIAKQRFMASQEDSSVRNVSGASAVDSTANTLGNAIGDGIKSLNQKQLDSEFAVETLASGGDISVHEVMIASEKASLNMQMAMQLRNKMISAYNELYQMRF